MELTSGVFFLGLAILAAAAQGLAGRAALGFARARPKLQPADADLPSVAVIIPSRGAPRGFASALERHADLDPAAAELIVAVESASDASAIAAQGVRSGNPPPRVVVAGLAGRGSQQNHNMRSGAAQCSAEILAFSDDDHLPPRDWTRRCVEALREPGVGVATGYRWVSGASSSWSAMLHVHINASMLSWFAFANRATGRALWGGLFAIRRADYERLRIDDVWKDAISDDLTLDAALKAARLETRLVPGLVAESRDDIESWAAALRWWRRQILNVKAYAPGLWLVVLLGGGVLPLLLSAAPVWALAAAEGPTRSLLLLAALVYGAQEIAWAAVLGGIGVVRSPLRLAAGALVFRLLEAIVIVGTTLGSSIAWAGVTYRFDAQGRVIEARRA
jgi:hypothetical protein